MRKEICFVIMGFGKKTDLSSGKTLDLDKTYKNIIKPAVEAEGYQCIRADEIQDSGLIDKSMYALLMYADLVVADISTYNPNAIYELGIRHAVRPYSTIIMNESEGKLPFDLSHNRTLHYSHFGDDIGVDEAEKCKSSLRGIIQNIKGKGMVDSPLYEFLGGITPPELSEEEYQKIVGELAGKEDRLFGITEHAKLCMAKNQFDEAIPLWKKSCLLAPNETYFTQQLALATYKSKKPSEHTALTDALQIMSHIADDHETNDPETLGIVGAIYKRLWLLTNDKEMLNRAIESYEKGFTIRNDYYTGENYALCLNYREEMESDVEEKIFNRLTAKKVRKEIVCNLETIVADEEQRDRNDIRWVYATLSNCYYGLGDNENGNKYEGAFKANTKIQWEIETFETGKSEVLKLTESGN